ncbi:TonB-linked SusC/RagA family outer membrane protein [Pedobacter cryoconitis]|uniref:SusC/RagA family TonB-linked outer membrane protein n=1 Tax=Pedobacter cryoconitis TaxID=188932 RepID=UPI001618AFD8|nr:SusC/RagA family TonB-linked outer membrane protein [Pedobacter cryoconitis]MBB6271865.1 TonB-linked SusC/RagA family outer membrane protein [Pedobacter cryoconitis]
MKKSILTLVLAALCLNLVTHAQNSAPLLKYKASIGRVISAGTGENLPGATIKVNMTKQVITADENGEFVLSLPNGSYNLSIYYLGYKTNEVTIQVPKKEKFIIKMETDYKSLQEVEINAGYYSVKDKERTGSISRVTAESIAKQPVSNPLAALIGQMSGVQITQQTGVPGGSFDVTIRGRNSLRKSSYEDGNLPFYIIDGVPFIPASFGASNASGSILPNGGSPFSIISPSDIESIEVLKDADATSIYGSRGANGVVLITTKKGRTGSAKIDISYNKGSAKVAQKMSLLSTQQYLDMRKEAFKNDGMTPTIDNAPDLTLWDQNKYTDWQKILIGGSAKTNNIQASLSGGSGSTQFLISGNYYKEGTVYPKDFDYQKGSVHFSLNHMSINQKFTTDLSVTYGIEQSNLPYLDLTSSALVLAPNAPDGYDQKGNLNFSNYYDNPYPYLEWKFNKNTYNYINSLNLSYQLFKGLKIKSNLSYSRYNNSEISSIPLSSYNPAYGYTSGNSTFVNNNSETFLAEPQIDYHANIGKGVISILLGTTLQKNKRKSNTIYADGFSSDALLENMTAASSLTAQQFVNSPYNYAALFGRINLNWYGKYILNLTGRRDGSSRFGPASRFANFGAAGLAWLFYKEEWIKNVLPTLSSGKLRSSIGITGNDQIGDFQYLDLWSNSPNYDGKSGLIPSGLFKSNYTWEKNTKIELALDLGFFQDRILFSASYYRNHSSNQLVGYSLAPTTGFNSVISNLPATVQNTGLELELNSKNIQGNRFNWNSSFNFTLPKNQLVSFPDLASSSYATTFQTGQPLSIKYGYIFRGVDKNTGLYIFDSQQGFSKKVTQEFYGGLQNNLSYKSLELSFHFQFVKQTGRDLSAKFYYAPGGMINQPISVLNRWQSQGNQTSVQKFTQNYSTEYNNYTQSDQTIVDASFLRLKNLQLAYRMENKLIKYAHIQQFRIYLQTQNLFTISPYKGLDPETQNGALPALRSLTLGIQLTF